jgi:hypothetical protein
VSGSPVWTAHVNGETIARISHPTVRLATIPRAVDVCLLRAINRARVGQPIVGSPGDLSQVVRYVVRRDGVTIVDSFACAPVRPIAVGPASTVVTA